MIMLIAFLAIREPVPGQAIAVIAVLLAIYLLVVGMGIIMAPLASERATEEMMRLAAAETATAVVRPELELMDAVPVAPLSPVTISVVGATGVCPHWGSDLGTPGLSAMMDTSHGRCANPL